MKIIDVITLSDNASYVMFLANKNGAIDCNLGSAVDDENQNIHIMVSDDKHQDVFEALQTYLSSSLDSSVVIRSSQQKSSEIQQNDMKKDVDEQSQAGLNLLLIVFLLLCVALIVLPGILQDFFEFFKLKI